MSKRTVRRRKQRAKTRKEIEMKKKKGMKGVPAAYGFTEKSVGYEMRRVSGGKRMVDREFLTTVYTNTGDLNPLILPINPSLWNGTALAAVARNFQQVRFHNVKFHYLPLVGTSAAGMLAMGFYSAGLHIGLTAEEICRGISRSTGSVKSSVWKACSARPAMELLNYRPWNIAELDEAPKLQLVAQVFGGAADGSKVGIIEVEYDVTLLSPATQYITWTGGAQGTSLVLAAGVSAATSYQPGTLFIATSNVDMGDISLKPGEWLICVDLDATDNTWEVHRGGSELSDAMTGTVTGILFERSSEY